MDEGKGCVDRYRQIENLVLNCFGEFGVVVSKRRHPHIDISVIDRGVRGGMVGSEGDRGPSIGLGVSLGPSSGGRRCRAGRWGGGGGGAGGRGWLLTSAIWISWSLEEVWTDACARLFSCTRDPSITV